MVMEQMVPLGERYLLLEDNASIHLLQNRFEDVQHRRSTCRKGSWNHTESVSGSMCVWVQTDAQYIMIDTNQKIDLKKIGLAKRRNTK